jgi:hypothetical protein
MAFYLQSEVCGVTHVVHVCTVHIYITGCLGLFPRHKLLVTRSEKELNAGGRICRSSTTGSLATSQFSRPTHREDSRRGNICNSSKGVEERRVIGPWKRDHETRCSSRSPNDFLEESRRAKLVRRLLVVYARWAISMLRRRPPMTCLALCRNFGVEYHLLKSVVLERV